MKTGCVNWHIWPICLAKWTKWPYHCKEKLPQFLKQRQSFFFEIEQIDSTINAIAAILIGLEYLQAHFWLYSVFKDSLSQPLYLQTFVAGIYF